MKDRDYTLTHLRKEHSEFLKMYATIVNVDGEKWYHLPHWYREEMDGYFEVFKEEDVPEKVKDFVK